jgi:2-(1,2-epoxy-1,2-dihydrophenyl)acetyl-CoA isomerase
VLTLDRPARRNALTPPFRDNLAAAIESALADVECRVIVLTGAGGHFCSGGDIGSFTNMAAVSGRTRMQRAHRMVRAIVSGEKPVIAAVEGHAAGAGLCLAADCDIVVASREAKFSCTFNRVGLFPDIGGLWSIPQRIGLGRTKMLMMSGRVLCADEAERQGLVELLCDPGQALMTALSLAQEVARNAPLTHGLVKSTLARGPMPLEALLAPEADNQGVLYGSEDFVEGRNAFLEKRAPSFRGA